MLDSNLQVIEKLQTYTMKILDYCNGYSYEAFLEDKKLVEACAFNLSQMGELVKYASEDFQFAHPQVPWHRLRGMRNRIVHQYEGFNLTIFWETIQSDLPLTCRELSNILEREAP